MAKTPKEAADDGYAAGRREAESNKTWVDEAVDGIVGDPNYKPDKGLSPDLERELRTRKEGGVALHRHLPKSRPHWDGFFCFPQTDPLPGGGWRPGLPLVDAG
jgi:hypothetical protein